MSEQFDNEINFSDVNWNKLTNEEFRQLEVIAQKRVKEAKRKEKIKEGVIVDRTPQKLVILVIDGKEYPVKEKVKSIYESLPEAKRNLMKQDIIKTYIPIDVL